jgi:ADP-heptose:LPS heptosyltransferase
MRNQLLRDADWAGMAHSIEIRVPLVDIELFRNTAPLFNAPCPPGKLAMAQAPAKPLPVQIVQREKSGFSIPVVEWLMASDGASVGHRGLRQWATIIYRESTGKNRVDTQDRRAVAVIIRTGQLGDTLMALPAIELLRRHHLKHRLVLLTDRQPSNARYVSAWDICKPTGWFDGVITYERRTRGWDALRSWASMLRELRSMKVDQFYNLAAGRSKWQAMRDEWFFSGMAGARHYHAPVPHRNPGKDADCRLHWMEPEWRHTLRGIGVEHPVDFKFCLPISDAERDAATRVATAAGVDFGARLLAFGPGSKMPAKIWPVERFAEVGTRVQKDFPDLQFAILGGQEDAAIGRALCSAWGERAHNLAGKLSIFGSAAILERCIAYVGNDTGTMHLAAMAGIPCVAIFSARDYPGRWDPYGAGHTVLRHEVACAGCLLEACEKFENKCLKLISVDEVHDAIRATLERASSKTSAAQSLLLALNASKNNFNTVDC